MPKKARELGALQVSRITRPGLHAVGGVAGLQLQVSVTGARSWILRQRTAAGRRDMGLGGFPDVTLTGAREAARAIRAQRAAGVDPLAERRNARSVAAAAVASALTFDEASAACIAAKTPEWKNVKHAAQWTATLATYASPIMGRLLVRDIALPHVLATLEPIWLTKTETASRVRARLESVLDWAGTQGYRDGLNPARWKGHLDNLLPKPAKVATVEHHPALPVLAIGAFMVDLRAAKGIGARALEFTILTAVRSGEVRGATWEEIDLEAAQWIIPKERMKMDREHRVPLSDAALTLLRALPAKSPRAGPVFMAPRGGMLSDMTLTAVIRRMNEGKDPAPWIDPASGSEVVPHGFRSTFRDWCSEHTNFPRDVAEMALAHSIGSKVEAAYRRGDLYTKRRQMMNAWAVRCATVKPDAVVTSINAKKANGAGGV